MHIRHCPWYIPALLGLHIWTLTSAISWGSSDLTITMFTCPNWSPPTYLRQTPGGQASAPEFKQKKTTLGNQSSCAGVLSELRKRLSYTHASLPTIPWATQHRVSCHSAKGTLRVRETGQWGKGTYSRAWWTPSDPRTHITGNQLPSAVLRHPHACMCTYIHVHTHTAFLYLGLNKPFMGVAQDHWKYQIRTLQFITVSKLKQQWKFYGWGPLLWISASRRLRTTGLEICLLLFCYLSYMNRSF